LPAQWPVGSPSRLRELPGVTAIRKYDGRDATSKPSGVYVAAVVVDSSLENAAVLPTALAW
jgi:phosphoribosylcarboxyaminoimidazole (NCAIR) mutase